MPAILFNFLSKIFSLCMHYLLPNTIISTFVNRFCGKRDSNYSLIFPFIHKRRSNNISILFFHRVNNDNDIFFPSIPVPVFKAQMEYLASHYNVISLEDAVYFLLKDNAPDNAIVITFDDGYKDIYLNAFPILEKLKLPVTIFLSTESIETGKPLWHDHLAHAFRETKQTTFSIGNYISQVSLQTAEHKHLALLRVYQLLKSIHSDQAFILFSHVIEKLDVCEFDDPNLMLDWDEVRNMHQNGISFGSHTVTHPILSKISLDQAMRELYLSKKIIEDKLGSQVNTFAYPNGTKHDFNDGIKSILKEAGYSCAVTTIFGTNHNSQDLYELRRGGPWEGYLPAFATKLAWYKFWY